jgi:hypothetical protein
MTAGSSRWRSFVAAASLLVLGAALGIFADHLHSLHRRGHQVDLAELEADPISVIARAVDLRPDQKQRVAAILEARQIVIDSAWHEANLRLRITLDSVINEIAAVLDPDQATRFRALADEVHGRQHRIPRP